MSQYPLAQIDKDQWNKKVNSCLMYTIPSQDEALPILCQIQQILDRLLSLPINQTITEENVEYFFLQVFPVVCQKIIKSRYFKNQSVLKKANQILEHTICLLPVYIDIVDKIPQMMEVIQAVFPEQFYFKTNNQLDHKEQPYLYFPKQENHFQEFLQVGSKVDVIKFSANNQKYFWIHGTILQLTETYIIVAYELDYEFSSKKFQRNSYFVAPYQSKVSTFQWRKNIQVGNLVDVVDSFGSWYNATVIGVEQQIDGRRKIEVTIKVYNQDGNKNDQKGRYFGFSDYKEKYDAFSAQIAPYCTVAKEFCYESTKSLIDGIDDSHDMECTEIDGKRIYALPRKKNLSETIFKGLNRFGCLGGFQKALQKIEQKADLGMLSSYLKGLSGVSAYLHKQVVMEQVKRIKNLLDKNILTENQAYTKQKSEMLFSGLRALLKRVSSSQQAYEYQNNLKMSLVELNFEHESLKKRLQGLNELKEVVKTLTFGSTRNKKIIEWIKERKIFDKVYLINSHVQLIKKSQSFFRYIINQNILDVQDLEKLFKMAQKGDYETRISLYALFQEVSHIFKKHHVNFLIDKILESEPHSILNEDIDLLHQSSKFSNYFPTKKVMEFFEKLVLADDIPQEINNYAIKKYSDMVAKNYEMKPYRKQIMKELFYKIKTHDIRKVTKILKYIFEGIGFGEWGRKDLTEILEQLKFEQVIIECIKQAKQKKNRTQVIQECMDILLSIYKLCSSFKIQIKTIEEIYQETSQGKELIQNYYKWCSEAFRCEQGIQVDDISQLVDLFKKLFENRKNNSAENVLSGQKHQQSVVLEELELLKSIFIEVNKRKKFLSVSTVAKDKEFEKQFKRKVSMKQMTFYSTLFQCIFDNNQSVAQKSLEFFKVLYCSGENLPEQIQNFLNQNLQTLKDNISPEGLNEKNKKKVLQTLKIIEFLIDDSEKDCSISIESLISKKKSYMIKLNFINSVSFISDTVKKLQVSLPSNCTLYNLRLHLAKQLDIPWKSVKIDIKQQIPYLLNCRTIKQLGLTGLQTLTVSRKVVSSEPDGQIIIDGEMNPKAIRVFKFIFDQFSTDQKMNRAQCYEFTIKCLGSNSSQKFYEEKIDGLFKEYDEDNDGLLTFNDFIKFYKNSSISRPSTVWSNLRSFGVQGNFKLNHEIDDSIACDKIPRNIMAKMPEIYDLLFRLLKQKEAAQSAFNLLQRLPVSKHIQEQILSVNQNEFDFKNMFDTTDLYVFLYKLNIIEYLIVSDQSKSQDEQDWIYRFIASEGYQQIIQTLFKFIQIYEKHQKSKVLLQILDVLIDISVNFLMKCFVSQKVLQSQILFAMQIDTSQKIEYLVTGKFSKADINMPTINESDIRHQEAHNLNKQEILNKILDLLQFLWKNLSIMESQPNDAKFEGTVFLQQILLMKLMMIVPIIQINEDFEDFASRMEHFINHSKNQKYLRKFYELILCLAFHSDEGKGPKIIIKQMFKHLNKRNIISEHFSTLAILVSRYGVQTTNGDEIVEALIKNVFSSNNELTSEGCSRLLQNFDLKVFNEKDFDNLWQNCLFGQEKRAKKNSTREALYQLILKASDRKHQLTNYIIAKIKTQISQCIKHMRITSCNEDNQRSNTGYGGLKNLGNICYINSMMQQLYMNKNFRYLVLRIKDNQPENLAQYKQKLYDDNILHQFQRIFAYLELTSRADYVPAGFCLAYKPFGEPVNVMIQQDVQEFVSMFFDQLQNKIKDTPFKKVIDSFYSGKTTNLFNCHDCNQTKKVEQNFYSITLQVKNSKTLNDSFSRYISGELISDFRCDFCNKKVDVSKKTRISKPPRTLVIHLQRIVFNLDTFINQKITTRHEFPMILDLYPYTLAQYEKPKQITTEDQKKIKDSMQYNLIGIICHIGNAESGHYISYIKIEENKWVQFNDSVVMSFSQSSIQSQCFGGAINSFMDDFEWDKASQTSKSAYILLYERQGETKIQAIVKSIKQKEMFLKQYSLTEVLQNVADQQKVEDNKQKEESGSHSETESDADDKLQEQLMKLEVEEKIRKKSKDINLELEKIEQIQKQIMKDHEVRVHIDEKIACYIPEDLKKQILHDNQIHFFEKNLASPAFVKFFSLLLKKQHEYHDDIIKMLKSLTFGFWSKSQHFKDLLKTCTHFIETDSKFSDELIFSNSQIVTFLIENPDVEVRSSVAEFLASTFTALIQKNNFTLTGNDQLEKKIVSFLDHLFCLLPTTVSKAWTKFNQYFEFWYEFGSKGQVQIAYMIRKQIMKHFLDYYLDKKSPLKIYENKPQIGSKYANPVFTMLLKAVTLLISSIINSIEFKLSQDDYKILINFDCMEKIISENCDNLSVNLVKQLCRQNLYASQKIAIIILKGLHKSTFTNVQAYLDVLHAYVLIEDSYQALRVKWVLGKPALHLNTNNKQIHAMSSYSFEQRLYTYHSSISLEQSSSLLDPIYELHKRAQNFAMMSLRQALRLCAQSRYVFDYIWNLPPPTLCFGTVHQFYGFFIERFLQDARRSYNCGQTGFNKEELGTQVKKIFEQLMKIWNQRNSTQNQIKKNYICQQVVESSSATTSAQSVPMSPERKQKEQDRKQQRNRKKNYHPIKFNYIQKQITEIEGLQITKHQSELTLALLKPTGKSNQSFEYGSIQKNIDRIKDSVWQTAKVQIVEGYYLHNKSKELLRIKTQDGTQLIKPNDNAWVWADQIERVWMCERGGDWPKWNLYSMQNKIQNQNEII